MKKNRIAILLPFKDHYTHLKAGSASIWVKDFNKKSIYKNQITVFGNTDNLDDVIDKNIYTNISLRNIKIGSKNIAYVDEFIKHDVKNKFNMIEVHNRPSYIHHFIKKNVNAKYVLIFHNNPLSLGGSRTIDERKILLDHCDKLIFVSNWVKEKFFEGFEKKNNQKSEVIYPSITKLYKFPKKKKIISFVGKLNRAKGFNIYGNAIIKILNKYKSWKSIVVGDEPREKYNFNHKNLEYKGWISHKKTLDLYNDTSISVVPSVWEEPFGRTAVEAASRGCATIVSKRGGLIETISNTIFLTRLDDKELYKKIEFLIKNSRFRKNIQINSFKNVLHDLNLNTKKIDDYRSGLLINNNFYINKKKQLKILHISNFGNWLFNRLYFISIAKKLSNGFIRSGHDVLDLSDRDVVRYNRIFPNIDGYNYLNKQIIETSKNYNPDFILLGHSYNIYDDTFEKIKSFNKNIVISQWFEDHLADTGPDFISNRKKLFKYQKYITSNFITTHPSALKFLKSETNYFYLPIPVDKNIERLNIYQNKHCMNDLFFSMSHGVNRGTLKKNKKEERTIFLDQLIKKIQTLFLIYMVTRKENQYGLRTFTIL